MHRFCAISFLIQEWDANMALTIQYGAFGASLKLLYIYTLLLGVADALAHLLCACWC